MNNTKTPITNDPKTTPPVCDHPSGEKIIAYCGWHPDHGYNFSTISETVQGATSCLLRTGLATGKHRWEILPLATPPTGSSPANQSALAEAREIFAWLDRKGGLGYDVHERIRGFLDKTAGPVLLAPPANQENLRRSEITKSAPVLMATHNYGEGESVVTQDRAGADTSSPALPEKVVADLIDLLISNGDPRLEILPMSPITGSPYTLQDLADDLCNLTRPDNSLVKAREDAIEECAHFIDAQFTGTNLSNVAALLAADIRALAHRSGT